MFFYMPTKVFDGENCLIDNFSIFASLGRKALIVTGKNSAKICGALDDVINSLALANVDYVIFDKIMSNPTIEVIYEGADVAKAEGIDYIIGIGGGSSMDAAKAIALLCENKGISAEYFLNKKYVDKALPLILIPTTCGTGSEVTPYAVITNDFKQTKTSVSGSSTFAKYAFVSNKYLKAMRKETLYNTVLDALSHNIEGYVSIRANYISDILSIDAIKLFTECLPYLLCSEIPDEIYDKLMKASVLGGIVISHTGTCAVHSLGYSYTYFKNIDHGKANAILLPEFLRFAGKIMPDRVERILTALKCTNVDDLKELLRKLVGTVEVLSEEEIKLFVDIGVNAASIKNSQACPNKEEIEKIYRGSVW